MSRTAQRRDGTRKTSEPYTQRLYAQILAAFYASRLRPVDPPDAPKPHTSRPEAPANRPSMEASGLGPERTDVSK